MVNFVRDPQTGIPLLCCWDDCGQFGDDRNKELYAERDRKVWYIFCTEAHQAYWVHSVRENGKLPSGTRNALGLR